MATICTYPPPQHALPQWKCLLHCCSQCPRIDLLSQELDKHLSNTCPKILFCVYNLAAHYIVHGRRQLNKKKQLLVFECSKICAKSQTICKKWSCNDKDVYCWLSHNFLHSIYTKNSILIATFLYSRDTPLWKHTSWSV